MTALDIVIVNWNGGEQLAACVQAIAAGEMPAGSVRTIVVDNGSSDDSLVVARRTGVPFEIRLLGENRGFSHAANEGARGSDAELLLFLNPDAMVERPTIRRAVEALEATDEKVGIVGVRNRDGAGRTVRTCCRLPRPAHFVRRSLGFDRFASRRFPSYRMTEWPHDETRFVDHVMGSFFLVRRKLFENLGGFDERFFLYLEDLDFSVRAAEAGWKTLYLADVAVEHEGGGSSRTVPARRLAWALESRLLYAQKHFGAPSAAMIAAVTLLVEPLVRILFASRTGTSRSATIGAYLFLLRRIAR